MFKYKLISMIIFSLAGILCAQDNLSIIRDIRVKGNRFIKEREVLAAVESRKGDYYSLKSLQDDIQAIYKLGHFNDVTLDVEEIDGVDDDQKPGIIVTFIVSEKKIIKTIKIIGNKKISRSKILSEIGSQKRESFDEGQMLLDVQTIESMYRDKGYTSVSVEPYTAVDEKTSKQIITFYVNEGNRMLIKKVTVQGTSAYSERRIRRKMKTRRKKVFKEETLNEDIKKLYDFYRNKGYINVHISKPVVESNEEKTELFVTLTIDEGRRYRVGEITFEGNEIFELDELRKTVSLKKDKIFKQEKLDETLQEIQGLYADKGYLRMRIKTSQITDEEKGIVDFNFSIIEDGLVYVDRIYVEGNTYTKEHVIRREIILKEGEAFSARKVRRSMEKIMNLGFLDDVQIDIQQPEDMDRADVVFEVREGKPGMLTAGAGFSSVDGLLGTLQVSHINLFGTARRINLMWEFGERRQSYDLSFTEPWFMNRPVSLGLNVFDITRKRQFADDFSAYQERNRGGSVQLGPRLTDRLSLSFAYGFKQIRVFDVDSEWADRPDNDPLKITAKTTNSSSLTSSIAYDTRDNIFDPTRGHYGKLSVTVSGGPFGGDVHFYKPIMRGSYHITTFWKFVLSLSGRVGYVESFAPSNDEDIFFEKYYVGGGESIRGYDYRGEIGPPEGGKLMSVFNAEYGFPLVQEYKRTILQFAIFADVGGAWRTADDLTLKIGTPLDYMKSGVGFGIRFKTPVFPIRLDWGYGLNHRPGEDLSQFYFTIGNVF
ncbi:MAG: outer membrane protein assembly factor BamA [Elusimicrobia bacterium]|nr:outer membrane protein assembly factor BamA [Elusimicrobiota bacterium]MBD3412235.1 outer membrane protein assembly factor BamA [Elusimicrobiota bacterium]